MRDVNRNILLCIAIKIVLSVVKIQGEVPSYVYIGCFKDSRDGRALPVHLENLRHKINWSNLPITVQECSELAQSRGYQYFAIQYYGECWSGPGASDTFYRHGPADPKYCEFGVGADWVNAVYRLQDMPACSNPLPFTAKSSSESAVVDGAWCSVPGEEAPWLEMVFNGATRITGIGLQGQSPDHWVTEYEVESDEKGGIWVPYKEKKTIRVFTGNSNWADLHMQWLVNPTEGRAFRIKPVTWRPSSGGACMQVRLYGCHTAQR